MEFTKHLIDQASRRLSGDLDKTQMTWSPAGNQDLRIIATTTIGIILFTLLFALFKCLSLSIHRSASVLQTSTNENPSLDEELVAFPIIIYGVPTEENPSSSFEAAEDCAVCLEKYEDGDAIRVLPRCKHMFHKECLEKWIQVPSLYCPICRIQMLERSIQPPSTSCTVAINHAEGHLHQN
ncbi:hypothetical protein SLEP1_g28547 [Rubroshorea leprosula]|uniref:RING-type domain-containing protein n=1 Tax=Rubroshorea leprosula TaxID=152421 RepID=A0AAV5JZP7_9ROSI|nr:hypothetical protein SLEP1_g28547 [Rubroshorea leprosula]